MHDADVTGPADILVALNEMLEDPAFQASARNKQFLRFVVEEALAGRAERIKSYAIAVDVFGRPSSFDGSTDPIVRIEANRLRAALAKYYGNPAHRTKIVISLPKGGYIPEFSSGRDIVDVASGTDVRPLPVASPSRDDSKEPDLPEHEQQLQGRAIVNSLNSGSPFQIDGDAAERPWVVGRLIARLLRPFRKTTGGPILFVDRVETLAGDARTVVFARGLGQSLISVLGRSGISVYREPPGYQRAVERLLNENPGRAIRRLSVDVWSDQDKVRFWWTLSDMRSMQIRLSANGEADWRRLPEAAVEAEIAQGVAAAVTSQDDGIKSFVSDRPAQPLEMDVSYPMV